MRKYKIRFRNIWFLFHAGTGLLVVGYSLVLKNEFDIISVKYNNEYFKVSET